MEIAFRTRKLQRQYQRSADAARAYGDEVGRKYIARIDLMKQARDIEELRHLPVLHCHPLKGDRLEIAMIEEVSKHYDD